MEKCPLHGGILCDGDKNDVKACVRFREVVHQGENGGGRIPDPDNFLTGPYWSREQWGDLNNRILEIAQLQGCIRLKLLQENIEILTTQKESRSEIY